MEWFHMAGIGGGDHGLVSFSTLFEVTIRSVGYTILY